MKALLVLVFAGLNVQAQNVHAPDPCLEKAKLEKQKETTELGRGDTEALRYYTDICDSVGGSLRATLSHPAAGPPSVSYPGLVAVLDQIEAGMKTSGSSREDKGATDSLTLGRTYYATRDVQATASRYRDELKASGIKFDSGFDGLGVSFRATDGTDSCVIRILEVEEPARTRVGVLCAPYQPEPTVRVIVPQTQIPRWGTHQVEYSISGSAPEVRITIRNSVGGTEQHVVNVPFHYTFDAAAGNFVYLSAQNAGRDGEIHVSIWVDGKNLQDAYASSPYGIATASGQIPK